MSKLKSPDPNRGRKFAAPAEAPNFDQQPPAFCFRYLVKGYGIEDCNDQEKVSLADTLWQLSQRRWLDLIMSSRHGSGCEKINNLKVPRPPAIPEDVSYLAFRFHKMAPMVGFREGRMFHILWLDRSFTVYKH
ncbi:MAG: hypothetical protein NW208_06340 [Bryobacter sp.]|nr:hypothetical protein [Bryobacter sp.]